jgi:hypothetical protein
VSGAAVGKAVTVDIAVGTEAVGVEMVNSGICVDGKAVAAVGPGIQADESSAAITKSNIRFRHPWNLSDN